MHAIENMSDIKEVSSKNSDIIAILYDVVILTINEHINNIFSDDELNNFLSNSKLVGSNKK